MKHDATTSKPVPDAATFHDADPKLMQRGGKNLQRMQNQRQFCCSKSYIRIPQQFPPPTFHNNNMATKSERGQSSKGPTKSELLEMFLDAGLDNYEGIPLKTLTVEELHSIYQDIRKTENATKLKKDPMSGITSLSRAEVDAVHEALTNVKSELLTRTREK